MRSLLLLLTITLLLSVTIFNSTLFSQTEEATTVGGYGELHYNEPDGDKTGQLDFHRFVLYLGHSFNDKLSFKSELELEHTKVEGTKSGSELSLEQAYLDWHFNQTIGLRAGIILPPVGIINQFHEPSTFHGIERPNVDRNIIPSTWRESGAGIYGSVAEGINYQLYVMAGLKASGFDSTSGIRGGRQSSFYSSPINPTFTGRVDYTASTDLKLGGSFFFGNTTEGNDSLGKGFLSLLSADAQYSYDNLALRAVAVLENLGDAELINKKFKKGVGDQMIGYYLEAAYNVLPHLCEESEQALYAFGRFEKYNTQAKVTNITANPLFDRNEITLGLSYKPTYNTVFKFDYQFFNNAAEKNTKQLNFGIGYNF